MSQKNKKIQSQLSNEGYPMYSNYEKIRQYQDVPISVPE